MRNTLLLLLFTSCIVKAQYNGCGTDEKSIALAQLIIENTGQKRAVIKCNKLLAIAAHEKAETMAKAGKISHTINHITANEFLRKHDIFLPTNYEFFGNQVEAIQGGEVTARDAFDYFMTSHSHKEHLLGENAFYQQQNQIGVSYFHDEQSKYEDFWVVYITEIGKSSNSENTNTDKSHYKFIMKFENNINKGKRKRFQRGDTTSTRAYKK